MGCLSQGKVADGRKDSATFEGLHLEPGRVRKTKVLMRGFQQLLWPGVICTGGDQYQPKKTCRTLSFPFPFFLAPPREWREEREGKGRKQRRSTTIHLFPSAGIQLAVAPD